MLSLFLVFPHALFSRVLPPSIFALPTCSQSAEYHLTVSRFIAAAHGLRVSQLHVSLWRLALPRKLPASTGELSVDPPPSAQEEGWCWRGGLQPAQRLSSSAGISERKEINHKPSSVKLCKADGLSWLLPFGGDWLSVLGALLHVFFPWWQSWCSPSMSLDV